MKNKALLFILSLLAPGAGQVGKGELARGAAFALAALLWGAARGPLVMQLAAPRLAGPSPESLLLLSLAATAFHFIIALAAALDAARPGKTDTPPNFAAGAGALLVFWIFQLVAGTLINRAAIGNLMRPKTAAVLEDATAGEAAAQRLVKEVESLPKGPFAGETRDGLFFDREKDNFKLQADHLAEAGPLEDSPEGQEVRIYPGRMSKDMTTGDKTVGQLLADGLIYLEIRPIPEALRADGGFGAYYADMMKKTAKEHADWNATVETRADLPMQAVLMTMTSPKQVRLYLFGKERYFSFRAYAWTPVLESMVKSFREAPAQNNR